MSDIDFALGFIAGEGSFSLTANKANGKRYPRMKFSIRVHEKDSDAIEECKSVFDNIGKIRTLSEHNEADWTVSSKKDLKHLRDKIENNSSNIWRSTEKYRNFQVWSDILDIHLDGRTTVEQAIEMSKIAKRGLNVDNGISETKWDKYIEHFKERSNSPTYICGAEKTGSSGVCQRTVSSEEETCWDH